MAANDKLVLIAEKAKSYVSLYDRIVDPARPRWTDEFLSAIWLERVARNRRIARVRKTTNKLGDLKKEATGALEELLGIANEVKTAAESSNAMAIGQMARLRSDLDLQRVHVSALRQGCEDTLAFVESQLGDSLPEPPQRWGALPVAFEDPNLSMEDKIRHQRQWNAILEAVSKVEALEAEYRNAEASYERSGVIENKCTNFLQRLQAENNMIEQRFADLENEIRIGELEQILSTLSNNKGGETPLIELRDYEILPENPLDEEGAES